MNLHVLMCVYNESRFIEPAIRSCLPHVKTLTIIEGAYRESIAVGASARSNDGTIRIIDRFVGGKTKLVFANEKSDPQQRNIGLDLIKKEDPNGWLLIIDGDEVYEPVTFRMIQALANKMETHNQYASYFKSITFVNDLRHYCLQAFPRLFRITPKCRFINDNFMEWPDKNLGWTCLANGKAFSPHIISTPNIEFFHYAFCKGNERFKLKKDWWQSRFATEFNYSWYIDDAGKIVDPDHQVYPYEGKHPPAMQKHPMLVNK